MELKQEKPERNTDVPKTDVYAAPETDGTRQGENEWGRYADWNEQTSAPYVSSGERMSKAEFYKQPALKKSRSNITVCAVGIYIYAVCNFVVLLHDGFGMINVCVLLGLGLGIHLGKSRVCAIILLAYAGITTICMLLTMGRFGGYLRYLILICGIYAVIETFKIQKAWKEYELTGRV